MADEALCEGVRSLLQAAAGFLPIRGLGVVRPDGPDHVVLTYVDPFGATGYRPKPDDIPEVVRPRAGGLLRLTRAELEANPLGLFESRVLHTRLPSEVRQEFSVHEIVTLPVPGADRPTTFVLGFAEPVSLTAGQMSGIESVAARVVDFLELVESRDDELERLRRLEAVDRLLPAFFRVLDVREIFDRLSAITRDVLRHDFGSVALFYDDWSQIELYVQTAQGPFRKDRVPMIFPPSQTSTFLYRIIDDLRTHPLERGWESVEAGGLTSIRFAIRLGETVLGAMNFTSYEPIPYTAQDLAIGQRIAEYVALALSHQRLAEESRRAAALQERAVNLEMLDGLLTTLTGVLDIREVFDRVSEIAQKVLPHDAMGLPILTDDREHIIPFATSGIPSGSVPLIQPIPESVRALLTEPWDFQIVEDLQTDPEGRVTAFARLGYRSYLRVPIRLGGELAGILAFFLRAPAAYTQADALVARRIADHVALLMSHQRLAEQARLNAELRSKAANLELLDELLTSVTDTGTLPNIFGRLSELARKVLSHDALVLTALQPDRRQARVYASKTPDTAPFPDVVDMPHAMIDDRDWEYEIVDDLQARADQQNMEATRKGYRAALRVPIRLDGSYVAGVSFLSFTPKLYGPADVAVARRIAERMTLSFARERVTTTSKRADEASARASKLESRVRELTEELDSRTGYRRVVGQSASWRQVLTQATQVAPTEATVLLLGESGTGKEVVARFLHRASTRKAGPFIALNCAALPEQLLEAELFGYERGAFTGAVQSKPGQLEQAAGGVLFLDEVGEMSLPAQAKFLRVLQEREFQRLGGTRVLRTDARIVAATNRDLQRAITHGQFREDLYYRLNVFAIHLPSLRDRREDILALSEAFLTEIGRGLGRPAAGISREARALLLEYHWPGNVRELRNILERASILCDGGLITAEHVSLKIPPRPPAPPSVPSVAPSLQPEPAASVPATARPSSADDLQSIERAMVEQALQIARFNKSKAAKALGLTRQQLYVRMRRYGLE